MLRVARARRLGYVPFLGILVRTRPAGTYDKLQLTRAKFDRAIFRRHAWPEWRIWNSPFDFYRAQSLMLWHFITYIDRAISERRRSGDRKGALEALAGAFAVFPLRATMRVITDDEFRNTALMIFRQ
jgi:hypothetical protein